MASEPFVFMTSVEAVQLTGRKAASLMELYLTLKDIEGSSLYHHTHRFYRSHSFLGAWDRSDFALWVAQDLKEASVAERMGSLDPRDYGTLEELRQDLLKAMEPLMEDKDRWIRRVPPGLEFHFCRSASLVLPTGHQASNLEEFFTALERVDTSCLYYHLIEAPLHFWGPERDFRNDFSQWLADAGYRPQAVDMAAVDPYRGDLEAVREQLLHVLRKDQFRAVVRRVVARVDRSPSGRAASQWLRRWRKEA